MSVSQWSLTTGRSVSPPPHTEVLGCRLGRGGVPLHLIVGVVSSDGGPRPRAPGPRPQAPPHALTQKPVFLLGNLFSHTPFVSPHIHRYYTDIRQAIPASDQEMNSALAELSRVRVLGTLQAPSTPVVTRALNQCTVTTGTTHTLTESVSSSALIELRGGS